MSDLYQELLGYKMEVIRKKEGVSQEFVGNLLNCTPSKISYYESGKRKLSILDALRFCRIFCIDIAWFLSVNDPFRIKNEA